MLDGVKGKKADCVLANRTNDQATTALIQGSKAFVAESLGNDTERVARCGDAALLAKLGACFGKFKGILANGVEFSSRIRCRHAGVLLHVD